MWKSINTLILLQINSKDVYPKIICDECLRELLVVAKFKEKVKLAENTLSQLITTDDRTSNCDAMIVEEETEEIPVDEYLPIKTETPVYGEEEEVANTGSYEEVEFLDSNGQTETLNAVQFVTIGKCDDEFIDEIIEECSVDESDIVETIVGDTIDFINRSTVKVGSCTEFIGSLLFAFFISFLSFPSQKSPPKQTPHHLNPSDSKVIINFNCAFCGAGKHTTRTHSVTFYENSSNSPKVLCIRVI